MYLSTNDKESRKPQPNSFPLRTRLFTSFSLILVLAGLLLVKGIVQAQDLPIVITKLASVEEAQVDDLIGYTIEVTNNGRVLQHTYVGSGRCVARRGCLCRWEPRIQSWRSRLRQRNPHRALGRRAKKQRKGHDHLQGESAAGNRSGQM